MIKAKSAINLHNRFDLKLVDSITGEVKQEAQAENTALNGFFNIFGSEPYVSDIRIPVGLGMGTGSGTPSPSDTGLFNRAFSMDTYSGTTGVTQLSRTIDSPTSTLVYSVSFPATSGYVGNLTEIGVYSINSIYITHAMLTDAEGNPITINKTALDILIVTVTLYLTITSNDSKFIPFTSNGITDAFIIGNESSSSRSPAFSYTALYSCATDKYTGLYFSTAAQNNPGSYTRSSRTFNALFPRAGTGEGNADGTAYYNGIGNAKLGYIRFPNVDVFPHYTVSDITVGTGDGSTSDFTCPFPVFVKDSDTIYKNGVALTRGVDYTISNVNLNLLNPCVTAGNFADIQVSCTPPTSGPYAQFRNKIPFRVGHVLQAYGDVCNISGNLEIIAHWSEAATDPTIGKKVNGFILPIGLVGSSTADPTFIAKVEYSNDGSSWIETTASCTKTYNGYSGRGSDYTKHYMLQGTFDEVDASYVKVTISASNYGAADFFYILASEYTKGDGGTLPNMRIYIYGALYYTGAPIHFTVPPADGDAITMSLKLDRPYKSSNYVLDASMSITFA